MWFDLLFALKYFVTSARENSYTRSPAQDHMVQRQWGIRHSGLSVTTPPGHLPEMMTLGS